MHLESAFIEAVQNGFSGGGGLHQRGHVEIVLLSQPRIDKARTDQADINIIGKFGPQAFRQIDNTRFGCRIDLALRKTKIARN